MKLNTITLIAAAATLFAAVPSVSYASSVLASPSPTVFAPSYHEAKTSMFKGIEVNKGHAMLVHKENKHFLKVSDDFQIPNSPAPHWQVVDSMGNTYLLNQLKIVGEKTNRQIELPGYIKDVKYVQIWCSFAEVLLGEASFAEAQKVN
ncbi:MAG: hypothetical protein KIT11_04735 [Fimbriimonadaceae bacterium]|nr:hypothetical protein [Fimbriimonadaceae bacterium]QYK56801.1 MAG: hypothetical protein KF733_04790 [Fimbriimonadaceae bacterium]